MALDLSVITNAFKGVPTYQKYVLLALLFIIVIGGFIYLVYIPYNNEIKALQADISNLNNQIAINETKARKLDELKKENAALKERLQALSEQLPAEYEVSSMLKQVADLGTVNGLDLKSWKPGNRKDSPTGLYVEVPVNVDAIGSYHNVATFFDQIGKLPRIINVSNLSMSGAKAEKTRMAINATFVIITYAASEGKGVAKEQPKTAKGTQKKIDASKGKGEGLE